jgi:hypothetical protein
VPNTPFASTAAPIGVPEFRHPILNVSSDESGAWKLARIMPLADPNEHLRFAFIVKRRGEAHIVRPSHDMDNVHTVSGLKCSSAFFGRQPGIMFCVGRYRFKLFARPHAFPRAIEGRGEVLRARLHLLLDRHPRDADDLHRPGSKPLMKAAINPNACNVRQPSRRLRREKERLTVALPSRLDMALWTSMPGPECASNPRGRPIRRPPRRSCATQGERGLQYT